MISVHHMWYFLELDTNQNKNNNNQPYWGQGCPHHMAPWFQFHLFRSHLRSVMLFRGGTIKVYFTQHVWNRIFSPRSTSCLRWSVGRSMVSSWFPWTGWLWFDVTLISEPVKTSQQSTPSGASTVHTCIVGCHACSGHIIGVMSFL